MKYGDKIIVRDGSRVDGCVGVVSRLEDEKVHLLLDKEVPWTVRRDRLVLEKDPY